MWSDSIFASLDRSKLAYLAGCCSAAYGGRRNLEVQAMSSVTQRTEFNVTEDSLDVPNSFTFTVEGESVALVTGTTINLQYARQFEGWLNPELDYGGRVNHYYDAITSIIYLSMPLGPKLFVGHSMGGPIAHMLATKFPGSRCVTFGSPRYADVFSAADPVWTDALHVSSPLDPAPIIPHDNLGNVLRWHRPGQTVSLEPRGLLRVNESPSSIGRIVGVAWTNGYRYHSSRTYFDSLGNVPNWNPPNLEGQMSNLLHVKVQGAMHEQSIVNEFWYLPVGSTPADPLVFGQDFARRWQLAIQTRVGPSYDPISYTARQFYGPVFADPENPSEGSVMRWMGGAVIPGIENEAAVSGIVFPSFVAVGIRKSLDSWRNPSGTIVDATKLGRGSFRIAGIPESMTGGTHDNKLTTSSIDSWNGAAEQLRMLRSEDLSRTYQMCVVSIGDSSGPFTTGTPPAPTYRYALVTSVHCNPYLTSQVSRKQSLSRLG